VPDVPATLNNTDTNRDCNARTGGEGKLTFLLLQPGKYRLAAACARRSHHSPRGPPAAPPPTPRNRIANTCH
jgi:hypothetical protein